MKTIDWHERVVNEARLRGFCHRTSLTYARAVRLLQNFCCKEPEEITEDDLRTYLTYCRARLLWGPTTMRIALSGLLFFFRKVLVRDWELLRTVRFERGDPVPVVMNVDEVRAVLNALDEPQNRAFFSLLYGCGLRLSEGQKLRPCDIDSRRGGLVVSGGKGNKQRWVPVPGAVMELLESYWATHRNPNWVFPGLGKSGHNGPTAVEPVALTTVQRALQRAVTRTSIRKHIRPHTFRHSYATHLLEAGVPIHHVQAYLGHASLVTVTVYLHITTHGKDDTQRRMNQLMRGVLSPLAEPRQLDLFGGLSSVPEPTGPRLMHCWGTLQEQPASR